MIFCLDSLKKKKIKSFTPSTLGFFYLAPIVRDVELRNSVVGDKTTRLFYLRSYTWREGFYLPAI